MDDKIRAFWQTTWHVFRSGALASLNPAAQQAANKPFEEFLKTDLDVNNSGISSFLRFFAPLPQEFLLGYDAREMHFVLTNRRLWLHDKDAGGFKEIDLRQVVDFRSSVGWNVSLSIRLKDGTEIAPRKLHFIPKEALLREAIARVGRQDAWGSLPDIPASSADVRLEPAVPKSGGSPDAPAIRSMPAGEDVKETYRYSGSFRMRRVVRLFVIFFAPLAFLGIGLWGVSGGLSWKYPGLVAVVTPIILIWLVVELVRLGGFFSFRVRLLENGIAIGKRTVAWDAIERIERFPGVDTENSIILHTRSGEKVGIPASIESPEYLCDVIEKRWSARPGRNR